MMFSLKIDPATGRTFGDHGSADDAIDFVLEHPAVAHEAASFLRYWDVGDLQGWPEFYPWLAAREAGHKPAISKRRRDDALLALAAFGMTALVVAGARGDPFMGGLGAVALIAAGLLLVALNWLSRRRSKK